MKAILLLILASLLSMPLHAQEGTYRIAGSTVPDGNGGISKSGYGGTVVITASEDVYTLRWTTSGGNYRGIGVKDGNRLIVAFGRGNDFGLVLFRRDGTNLNGDVKFGGDASKFGSEIVSGVPSRNLNGSFSTIRMANGVEDFSGQINLKSLGQTVQATWTGGKRYQGVGIPQGDVVPTAFGVGAVAGVIIYEVSADGRSLKGTYAVQNDGNLYLESLLKQ